MKFPKLIGRRELMHAAIIGTVAGLAGVLFFILLLSSMNSSTEQQANQAETEAEAEAEEEIIPVQTTENAIEDNSAVEFFANQHGVFTSYESATDFMEGYASLNTSAIVEVDGNYYIWSSIAPIKEELILSDNPTSFAKSFKFSGGACTDPTIKNLPITLESNDPSKFYFEEGKVPDNIPQDWQSITSALSSFSQNLGTVRLHLLAHYFSKNDCLKIEF